jgi:hypothetical protein
MNKHICSSFWINALVAGIGNAALWLIGICSVPEAASIAGIKATSHQLFMMNWGFFSVPRFFAFLGTIYLAQFIQSWKRLC